jgi:hypothetical protein
MRLDHVISPFGVLTSGHVVFAPVHVAPLHSFCRHEDRRPVAVIPANGNKEDYEVGDARAILANPKVRLENMLVTVFNPVTASEVGKRQLCL